MNRKIIIGVLVLISMLSIFLTFKSLKNKPIKLDEVKVNDIKIDKSMFGLFIEQEDGTYEKSDSDTWPTEYIFNKTASGCIGVNGLLIENDLSYDSITNVMTINTDSTSYCYVYFDIEKEN